MLKKFLSNSVTNVLARQVTFRPSYVSEGQAESFFFSNPENSVAPNFTNVTFIMIEGRNAHDKIISDRRSKCMRSDEMKVQSFCQQMF